MSEDGGQAPSAPSSDPWKPLLDVSPRWKKVPQSLMKNMGRLGLTATDIGYIAAVESWRGITGEVYVGNRKLACSMRVSIRKLQRWKAKMVGSGYLTVKPRTKPGSSDGLTEGWLRKDEPTSSLLSFDGLVEACLILERGSALPEDRFGPKAWAAAQATAATENSAKRQAAPRAGKARADWTAGYAAGYAAGLAVVTPDAPRTPAPPSVSPPHVMGATATCNQVVTISGSTGQNCPSGDESQYNRGVTDDTIGQIWHGWGVTGDTTSCHPCHDVVSLVSPKLEGRASEPQAERKPMGASDFFVPQKSEAMGGSRAAGAARAPGQGAEPQKAWEARLARLQEAHSICSLQLQDMSTEIAKAKTYLQYGQDNREEEDKGKPTASSKDKTKTKTKQAEGEGDGEGKPSASSEDETTTQTRPDPLRLIPDNSAVFKAETVPKTKVTPMTTPNPTPTPVVAVADRLRAAEDLEAQASARTAAAKLKQAHRKEANRATRGRGRSMRDLTLLSRVTELQTFWATTAREAGILGVPSTWTPGEWKAVEELVREFPASGEIETMFRYVLGFWPKIRTTIRSSGALPSTIMLNNMRSRFMPDALTWNASKADLEAVERWSSDPQLRRSPMPSDVAAKANRAKRVLIDLGIEPSTPARP